MATPQREDGHIDIANDIAEQLAKVNLSPYESRLMWAVLRKTWGYVQRDKNGKIIKDSRGWLLKKKFDWVSVSQLQELTDLDRRNVSRMKLRLLRRKILIKNGNKLGFNRDYDQWLSLKQTTDNIVYRDTRYKWFPPSSYAFKHSDGGLCGYCLEEFRFNKDELESHHIIPISMGGKDIKENQILLCIPCHKKIEKEFKELNIVDLDDIPKIQKYYRQFVSLVSSKQTTFLSSKLTNTKEKRNITKETIYRDTQSELSTEEQLTPEQIKEGDHLMTIYYGSHKGYLARLTKEFQTRRKIRMRQLIDGTLLDKIPPKLIETTIRESKTGVPWEIITEEWIRKHLERIELIKGQNKQ